MLFRNAATKTFSTAARIHPNIQPLNPASSRMPRSTGGRKWVFPTVALMALGAAIAADQISQARQHHVQEQMAIQEAHLKRQRALMDAYGNKESLEDLEAALDYYEVQ